MEPQQFSCGNNEGGYKDIKQEIKLQWSHNNSVVETGDAQTVSLRT